VEFVEYYKIIRRRIWLIVMLAVIAAAPVVIVRLVQPGATHRAQGALLVHDAAKRNISFTGAELQIAAPTGRDAGQMFWSNLDAFIGSHYFLTTVAAQINIVGGELERRLEPFAGDRVSSSDMFLITSTADSSDTALAACTAAMAQLSELWRERQVWLAEQAQERVTESEPDEQQRIVELQPKAGKLIDAYDGSSPTEYLANLTQQLGSIELQIATVQVSLGASRARSNLLEQRGQPGATLARASVLIASSPRVIALVGAITEKQIALDETRARRTSDHPEVKALEAQIQKLEERLVAVREQDAEEGSLAQSPLLQQNALQAELDSAALASQLDVLGNKADDIRARLPQVRDDAQTFDEINTDIVVAKSRVQTLEEYHSQLEREAQYRQNAIMMEEISAPRLLPRAGAIVRFIITLAVALLAGAGIGILIIFVWHYVDYSFYNAAEAENMVGERVLVGIPRSDVPIPATQAEVSGEGQELPGV